MKYLLAALLTIGLLPATPHIVVSETPGECAVTAVGSVEVYLRLYYNHEDPNSPGSPYTYTGPVRVLSNETASIAYDWQPVAFEWYYKPYGTLIDSEIVSPDPLPDVTEGEYQLGLVCGVVPDSIYAPPTDPAPDPVDDCPATVTGSVEMYLRAYYMHEDSEAPGQRFTYTTELVIAENEEIAVALAEHPATVEWWYRPYGIIVVSSAEFQLAKVCGDYPELTLLEGAAPPDDLPLFATLTTHN